MEKKTRRKRVTIHAYTFDKRGRLLSEGINSYEKTHPLMLWYGSKCGQLNKPYLHAEVDALIKTKGKKVHKLIIIRRGADGQLMPAAPCSICTLAIKEFGVKVIEHS